MLKMILTPHHFKQYLRAEEIKPHGSGWGILFLGLSIFLLSGFPLLAPPSVSFNLPQVSSSETPLIPISGGQILTLDGSTIIYQGRLVSLEDFSTRIKVPPVPSRLMILSNGQTSLGQALPIINAAEEAGILDVSFIVKP